MHVCYFMSTVINDSRCMGLWECLQLGRGQLIYPKFYILFQNINHLHLYFYNTVTTLKHCIRFLGFPRQIITNWLKQR